MIAEIAVTEAQLVAAFTEWERRDREHPELATAAEYHMLGDPPESYGRAAAAYLLSILEEQRSAVAS